MYSVNRFDFMQRKSSLRDFRHQKRRLDTQGNFVLAWKMESWKQARNNPKYKSYDPLWVSEEVLMQNLKELSKPINNNRFYQSMTALKNAISSKKDLVSRLSPI